MADESLPRVPGKVCCDVLCGTGGGNPYLHYGDLQPVVPNEKSQRLENMQHEIHKRSLLDLNLNDFKLPASIFPNSERITQVKDIIENVETGIQEDLIEEEKSHSRKTLKYECLLCFKHTIRFIKYFLIGILALATLLGGYSQGMKIINVVTNPQAAISDVLHDNATIHSKLLNPAENKISSIKKIFTFRDTVPHKNDNGTFDSGSPIGPYSAGMVVFATFDVDTLRAIQNGSITNVTAIAAQTEFCKFNETHDALKYNETIVVATQSPLPDHPAEPSVEKRPIFQAVHYMPTSPSSRYYVRRDPSLVNWQTHVNELVACSESPTKLCLGSKSGEFVQINPQTNSTNTSVET